MSPVKKIQKFLGYWYQRYLLATEMYMVEPWEKAVILACIMMAFFSLSVIMMHATALKYQELNKDFIFLVLFTLFWWFNSSIVVSSIARLRNTSQMELVS